MLLPDFNFLYLILIYFYFIILFYLQICPNILKFVLKDLSIFNNYFKYERTPLSKILLQEPNYYDRVLR
jgi:hypothetical protein